MNLELMEKKTSMVMEIYLNNGRSAPNAFKMREILQLKLKRRRFGEYVNVYKKCNNGYS